ncbi:hypothetical protein [Vibrio vulnificus]|uniref:hypothetical protein n=1 Tax=Vibrio vulnificus TaxID=672 RepID=UPI000DAE6D26|nr:hypothetical protein [Vibrio vulnificus]MDK2622431.1 hypothetical protein [Vibrio vulnificus]RAH17429.1 hypothetical protein DOT36_22665 [Vibrio vulnificus]
MDKNVWALHIGHLMISMNEIDWMTNLIRIDILQKEITENWKKFSLAERLKKIADSLDSQDKELKHLKELLLEALEHCRVRNLVAHGSFALDCREPTTNGGSESKYILHSLKHDNPITEKELKELTKRVIYLSDKIAERHAYIRMRELKNTQSQPE